VRRVRVEEFVGARIRDRRRELHMSQQELGERLGSLLGKPWSSQTVSAAELGKRAFTAAELWAIARVLETRAPRLLTPPIDASEIELPGGATLDTRELVDFGVADSVLAEMGSDIARVLQGVWQAADAAADLQSKLTTAIAVTEVAALPGKPEERP
jgi:transcriptional regulator with XRE-family HTH domain